MNLRASYDRVWQKRLAVGRSPAEFSGRETPGARAAGGVAPHPRSSAGGGVSSSSDLKKLGARRATTRSPVPSASLMWAWMLTRRPIAKRASARRLPYQRDRTVQGFDELATTARRSTKLIKKLERFATDDNQGRKKAKDETARRRLPPRGCFAAPTGWPPLSRPAHTRLSAFTPSEFPSRSCGIRRAAHEAGEAGALHREQIEEAAGLAAAYDCKGAHARGGIVGAG